MEPAPASLHAYVYRPRAVAFQGVRAAGRWQLKTTVITVRGRAAHFADIIAGAGEQADRLLAAIPAGPDAGVAQLIVHIGTGGVWLLLDWWSEGDVLMHRHFHATLDDPTRFTDVAPHHLGPCVWDLAVQAHEREVWLRHVLANPNGPDLAAYLGDGLTATL